MNSLPRYKEILLKCGQSVIVDSDDYDHVVRKKWYLHLGYPCFNQSKPPYKRTFMHRVINNTPEGFHTDHINGNKLDNRKCNLRTVTHSENMRNRKIHKSNQSGYKGVYFDKGKRKWVARITFNKKVYKLGHFNSPEMASIAYELKSKELFKEYKRSN